jgi:GT2 family glycosyltransferase
MAVVDRRVGVVIPCQAQLRWPQLVERVASVQAQRPAPATVVVAVDSNPDLLARAHRELTGVTVVPDRFARGAAGTRNSGASHADTSFVALLDDDARARPGWLARLVAPSEGGDVVGTAGAAVPDPRGELETRAQLLFERSRASEDLLLLPGLLSSGYLVSQGRMRRWR